MTGEGGKARARRSNSGWVAVKISTRRSDRVPRLLELNSEFRVDEHGALLVANAASCTLHTAPEAERSIIEGVDVPVHPEWRARIHYDVYDHSFWFTPLASCPTFYAPAVVVPSRRRDIFVQLGERGSTAMSWPLQAGDGFRIGHTYVVVLRVLHNSLDPSGYADPETDAEADSGVSAIRGGKGDGIGQPLSAEDDSDDGDSSARAAATGGDGNDSDGAVYGDVRTADGDAAECCFCYEPGIRSDPLMRACRECRGSVQYVHLSCLRRWSSPQGSGRVPAQCPTCKRDLRKEVQEKLVMPPALLLEIYWSHHRQSHCHELPRALAADAIIRRALNDAAAENARGDEGELEDAVANLQLADPSVVTATAAGAPS
ncbi:hypothetical protein T492DRAFT_1089906 [Pavlovales sp. CCMP2436]|nr:hypothetical protein T492DRAFT_1089906 [Pavlovales sp. CCMP2436]